MTLGDNNVGNVKSADWLQKIHTLLKSAGGIAFFGNITTANTTTNFKVESMAGLGTDLLNDAFYCQIIQADAAAPEGEIQKVSAYDTSDGDITVGAAFTVAPEVGDYVLVIHESVVTAIADSTDNLFTKDVIGNKTDASTIPSTTTSLVAMLKKVYDEVIGITIAGELFYASGPAGLEIDDVGNYNIGLYDVGDGIPTAAEITAGNYQIDRIRDGATTNIVASVGASKDDGRIYCGETFDAVSGWAVGDLVLVTFSGGSVTPVGGATTVLPNAYLYSRIVRGEVIQALLVDGLINGTGTVLPTNKSVYDEVALDRLDNATYGLSALNDDLDAILVATDKQAGAAPSTGTATENWNTAEANIVSIGANDTKNKLHSLVLSIDEITAASVITIRMYMQTNGVERKVYDQDYTKDSDPDGLWIVNGTVGIHEVLRVTAESDTAADDGKNIDYDFMVEVM